MTHLTPTPEGSLCISHSEEPLGGGLRRYCPCALGLYSHDGDTSMRSTKSVVWAEPSAEAYAQHLVCSLLRILARQRP